MSIGKEISTEITHNECPVCGAQLILANDAEINELIECIDCGTELEITSLSPILIEEAPIAEEDWGQ